MNRRRTACNLPWWQLVVLDIQSLFWERKSFQHTLTINPINGKWSRVALIGEVLVFSWVRGVGGVGLQCQPSESSWWLWIAIACRVKSRNHSSVPLRLLDAWNQIAQETKAQAMTSSGNSGELSLNMSLSPSQAFLIVLSLSHCELGSRSLNLPEP